MTGTNDGTPSEAGSDDAGRGRRPLVVRLLILLMRIVLAALLLQAGIGKLLSAPVTITMFESLGGAPMRYTVGTLETAGAIALLIPILSGVAAIGVSALFVIIVTTQLSMYGPSVIGLAVVVLVLAIATGLLQWHQTVRLIRFLRRSLRPTPTSN